MVHYTWWVPNTFDDDIRKSDQEAESLKAFSHFTAHVGKYDYFLGDHFL